MWWETLLDLSFGIFRLLFIVFGILVWLLAEALTAFIVMWLIFSIGQGLGEGLSSVLRKRKRKKKIEKLLLNKPLDGEEVIKERLREEAKGRKLGVSVGMILGLFVLAYIFMVIALAQHGVFLHESWSSCLLILLVSTPGIIYAAMTVTTKIEAATLESVSRDLLKLCNLIEEADPWFSDDDQDAGQSEAAKLAQRMRTPLCDIINVLDPNFYSHWNSAW